MPNQNKSLIAVVLDRSGSMGHLQQETISGVNKFVADQQAVPGECDFTLVQFSTDYTFTHNAVPLKDIKPLTTRDYMPAGYTALLDAVGRCVDETGKRLDAMAESDRPGKVIVVIVTDGGENSSKEYRREQIADKVRHQESRYGWQFVFLAANMDAIAAGAGIGIRPAAALNVKATAKGVGQLYASVSSNAAQYRSGNAVSMDWSAQDRKDNS